MMRCMTFGYEHHISKVKTLHAVAEIDDRPDCSVSRKAGYGLPAFMLYGITPMS